MISVKETQIEEAVKVSATVTEFDEKYDKSYFENRYQDKEKLIIVAYADRQPAGFIVGYDKFGDGSFYCWMAGVNPEFRQKGVMKAMMDYQKNWAKEKGYDTIKIKTRNSRREMLSYLVKEGFYLTSVEQRETIEENRINFEKNLG
ncbi:MAG: GNAT family N-acetyltransferase [archaeon]